MSAQYGFVKCKVAGDPKTVPSRKRHETQYHVHAALQVGSAGRSKPWDTAINVGTNDSDDLLRYKFVFDFHHPIRETLKDANPGFQDLTGTDAPPALDFLRSDILKETGPWRNSDVMHGSGHPEPAATLLTLLRQAKTDQLDVYIFGHTYQGGDLGMHDIHMNQGSSGSYINDGRDDNIEANIIWQDGAVIVDLGGDQWAAYFTAFTQQTVPTDDLGNPTSGGHTIAEADEGSFAGQ